MKRDIRLLLAAINALLIAVLMILVFGRQTHWQPPKPIAPALSQATGVESMNKFDLKSGGYPQITMRPLFWPSRKPPPEKIEESAPASVADPFKEVTLLGTFLDRAASGAIIRLNKEKKVIRLAVNEIYQGWILKAVSPESALFEDKAQHQKILKIEYAKQPDQPKAPVRPPGKNSERR